MWLWLQPEAWASKLTCLQLQGVPYMSTLPLQELTRLQRLVCTGSLLETSAVQQLLEQLGSCTALTALVLACNGLYQLPEQGWERVTGLKVGVGRWGTEAA